MHLRYYIAVAASGGENMDINDLGGGNDLIVVELMPDEDSG